MKNADSIFKYIVLLTFTIYIGMIVWHYLHTAEVVNLPDWLVMLFTVVFMYFFRRAPKNGGNDVKTVEK